MNSRPTKPSQEEVDSLAAFIEAAEEFQHEPFCSKEKDNLLDAVNQAESYEGILKNCGFQIELVAAINRQDARETMANKQVLAIIPCHTSMPPDFDSVVYVGKRIVTEQGAIDFFDKKLRRLKDFLAQ